MKRILRSAARSRARAPTRSSTSAARWTSARRLMQAQEGMKDLTQDEEIALGEQLTAGFLGASPLHPDANLQRYVNRVGKWLALHSDRPTCRGLSR